MVSAGIFISLNQPQNNLKSVLTQEKRDPNPSATLKEYTDPVGFSFNYPDNISIQSNEIIDANTYADLQLFSKEVNGNLSLQINDSKYTTIDDWLKVYKILKQPSREVKLGNLKAFEVKTNDRLYLGALDQGIFFTIEVPLLEEDFWMKVYSKVLADFSFTTAENTSHVAGSSDISFEGEEVVE